MLVCHRSVAALAALLVCGSACAPDGELSAEATSGASVAQARQSGPASIFPELHGSALLARLRAEYRPRTVLPYDKAIAALYAKVDNDHGTLACVYTGYAVPLPAKGDVVELLKIAGMSLEHSWPQSKGATAQAKADMHHLYPARLAVNSARGNAPFDVIPDQAVDTWYRGAAALVVAPIDELGSYSKRDKAPRRFEVRDVHKGDTARSMFYFYAMYGEQADAADAAFYPAQAPTLRAWHEADPADAAEVARTWRIAALQDERPNPFVLDPTLVSRAFFSADVVLSPVERFDAIVTGPATAHLRWQVASDYDPAERDILVLGRAGLGLDAMPKIAPVAYVASATLGDGAAVGIDSYVLASGDLTELVVEGLAPDTNYAFKVWTSDGERYSAPRLLTVRTAALAPGMENPHVVGRLVVVELMVAPSATADALGQWLEIYNSGVAAVDLDGWVLRDDGSDFHLIATPTPLWVPAGGVVVLGPSTDLAVNGGVRVDYRYSDFNLERGGDQVVLVAPDQVTEVDRVAYDGGARWPNTPGAAMVLRDRMIDNSAPDAWDVATEAWDGGAGDLGTPGR